MNTERQIRLERQIVRRLLREAKKAGFKWRHNDGVEWTSGIDNRETETMAELHSTCEQYIHFYRIKDGKPLRAGFVLLIYGNDGFDVIADEQAAPDFRPVLDRVSAYVDRLERMTA